MSNSIPPIYRERRDRASLLRALLLKAALCWSALAGLGAAANAQDMTDSRLEYNVKAASLYAFGRFVTWPDSAFKDANSPFLIGVLGANPFGDALDQVAAKKTINGRPITIRHFATLEECSQTHILFVTQATAPEAEAKLFKRLSGKPVLLVGESPGFAERGGVINFYLDAGNVRFELNADKAAETQLSLNAKLLSLGVKTTARR